jgi:hypothetical protein
VRGKHLEHTLVLFVELIGPEVREHDDAGHLVAHFQRHGQERLVDLVGPFDLPSPLVVEGVVRVVRLSRARRITGDPLADKGDQLLVRLGLVLGQVAAERRRPQRDPIVEQEVDPTVVVVDQGPELGGDGFADRVDVVERVQPGRQGMQHPELRDRAQLVCLDGSAHAVAGFDHP